jgi:hypothetical protein
MKSSTKYATKVVTTGFVVLLLTSILIFWALKTGQAAFYEELVIDRTGKMSISPSGVLPKEIESEPNVVKQSELTGYIGDGAVYGTLGLLQDAAAEIRSGILLARLTQQFGTKSVYAVLYDKTNDLYNIVYFDKKLGLFVMCDIYYRVGTGENGWVKDIRLYAGPNGTSPESPNNLGRFTDPLADRDSESMTSFIFFEPLLSRFFKIDFAEGTVTKGPQVRGSKPVAVGRIHKNSELNRIGEFKWIPPLRKMTEEEYTNTKVQKYTTYINGLPVQLMPIDGFDFHRLDNPSDVLVLTASSDIFQLDEDSLELDGRVGILLDENLEAIGPERLLSFKVIRVEGRGRNFGTIVGQVSADAHKLSVYTFGEDGAFRDLQRYSILDSYAKAGGPLYLVFRYVLENLRPAALSLVSYFTTSSFEAAASHQALFLPPESFVGWHSRNAAGTVSSFLVSFIIVSPALALGAVIAWFIKKDAVKAGLPKQAQVLWIIAAVAFGIAAGITYLLTKDTTVLVTCRNCGKMRRPDMETCHRCGAGWDVPELRAVTWRVSDT